MKSRLLSTAAALFLLLGLVSTSAFAQVTSANAVKFNIRTYQSDGDLANGWHSAAVTTDTVGRKMDVSVEWAVGAQSLSSVNYTITLPKGTVLQASAKDSVLLKIYSGFDKSGTPQVIKVDPTKVTLVQNDTTGYSGSTSPSLTVTSDIMFDTNKILVIEAYRGIYIGKLLSDVNSATTSTRMKMSLNISSQAGTTFSDSSLAAVNDLADGLKFNTSITGYIDSKTQPFSSSDTIVIVDRFGNNVPDYFNSAADSLVISVPANSGYWSVDSVDAAVTGDTPYTDNTVTHAGASEEDSTKIVINYDGTLVNTSGSLTATDLYHRLGGNTSTYLLLGMRSPGAVTVGGLGLAFDGDAATDSTTFTFKLYGNVAQDTVLNVINDNQSSVTRARLQSDDSKNIGSVSVAWTTGGITYVGGLLNGTLAITLKNIFGDNFSDGAIGTVSDSLKISFAYVDSGGTINTTKTTTMASGKQVTSLYSMPATTLDYSLGSGTSTNDHIAGQWIVGSLTSSVFTISAANTNLPVYYGMASHSSSNADSIRVYITAQDDATKRDSFMIRVEPGSPVAFDLDTLKANLATINPVKGAQLPVALPMFALDTAYNRIKNFDLKTTNTFLEAQTIHAASVKAINLKIDGRDPAGTASATADSIRVDSATAVASLSKSAIYGYAPNSGITDSSVVNLGGVNYAGGDDAMGLRLLYKGLNYVLSMVWNPAQMGSGWNPGADSVDIGLFTLQDTTAIDSAQSLTLVSTGHKAGATDTLILSFVLPQGNSLGPNLADSLIYVNFQNMAGAAGLPVGLAKTDVQVSLDGITYYDALGVSSITSEDEDSIWIASPVTLNAASASKTGYIKFFTFKNPTIANIDSVQMYPARIKTEATPVAHTKKTFMDGQVIATDAARLIVVTPMDTLKRTYPRWVSEVVEVSGEVSLTAGTASSPWKILQADTYGNIVNNEAGNTRSTSKTLIFMGPDTTSGGNGSIFKQTFDGVVTTTTARGIYDTLAVKTDSASARGIYADSVQVTLYNSNQATAYYLKVMDTTMAVRDSVMVNVAGGTVASLTLDPDSNMAGQREANLPTLTVTAKDTYGNPKAGASVTIARTYGADGAFVDSNGTALTAGADTITVVTKANGTATAIYKTGAVTDSVALMVSATGATSKYFTAKLTVASQDMKFTATQPADSLEPDLAIAGTIKASVEDGNSVSEVWVNVWSSKLTRNSGNTWDAAEASYIEKAASVTGSSDIVQVSFAIGDTASVDTGVVIKYQLVGVDGTSDTTYSDTMMYVVAPNRGKRNMTNNAVSVADVMRLVYLIAIDEIVPRDVDYFGLDLDVDGTFDTPDLLAELAIWKGTGTLLAGVTVPENATAKAELSYEATDKATANVALNLEASDNMNVAVFRIKYDTEKFVFGEAKATDRLQGVSVVSDANESEGIYTVIVVNTEGGQIVKGSGAILNIDVRAAGEKFDGVGEISLLNASFDEGVAAEISREVIAPKALLPKAFAMSQNYPNPFNPSTTIAYDIPEGDNVQVQLKVYNMRGQLVRTLVDESKSEGSYQVQWDGADNYGRRVSSGVYFYRIKAGEFSNTRKMVILK